MMMLQLVWHRAQADKAHGYPRAALCRSSRACAKAADDHDDDGEEAATLVLHNPKFNHYLRYDHYDVFDRKPL